MTLNAVTARVAGWPPEAQAAFLAEVKARTARLRTLRECPTPAHLAARLDHTYVRTPAIDLIAAELVRTLHTYDGRLVFSIGPQQGKSTLLRYACLWALLEDPGRRIVYASYAVSLARVAGREVRNLIDTHGPMLGLAVSRDHADAADWQLAGHRGGMVAVGVGGALTGRPCDWLIPDDTLRGQQDADSATIRTHLHTWWESTARTRLAPGAPITVVGTRWHEDDLSGRRIAEGWPVINIPAFADGQTPDALNRPVGEYLVSTRGHTPEDWDRVRHDAGERAWAALFQGRPAPLEGGVFKRAWFDTWRVPEPPEGCSAPVIVVDPADNEGSGDEAGIIVAARHPQSRKVYILDDLSAPMTVARWARVACLTCVRRDAPTIAYEQSLAQLPVRMRAAWTELHTQALAYHYASYNPDTAVARLVRPDDPPDARQSMVDALAELTPADCARILDIGETGPRLVPIRARGQKTDRMRWAAPRFENGEVRLVGRFPVLEHQCVTWQEGMSSPDRVDALCHAAAYLGGLVVTSRVADPLALPSLPSTGMTGF